VGLLSSVFGLPFAPVRGVIWLGEVIQEQVEHEMADPSVIRHKLEEIEEARAAGLISEEEEARAMEETLQRMMGPLGAADTASGAERG
jgi:hypothetical protein